MLRLLLPLSILAICAFACGGDDAPTPDATAELVPLMGSGVEGIVTFTHHGEGEVLIEADITGLTPGKHGFHIHEWGDCSAPDGSSAGGHFNPDMVDHGDPAGPVHHAGDYGNLVADADGHAVYTRVMDTATFSLSGGKYDIRGRAVIIHADPDDFMTQPTGNAGGRLACGVIQPASGEVDPVLPPGP
ncbi:MAG TPA: superoxide dismutase family protein [Nannocystis sp.]